MGQKNKDTGSWSQENLEDFIILLLRKGIHLHKNEVEKVSLEKLRKHLTVDEFFEMYKLGWG